MANTLRHKFVSAKSDVADTSLVRPSNWNEEHPFSGGSDGQYLGYKSANSDHVEFRAFPYINIKAPPYNATGDGTTDDTAAFTSALAVGGHILIPPGIYKITSTLTISKGTFLEGMGAGPGAVVGITSPTQFPGAILDHSFNGTFIDVLGVNGDNEAGVGTTLQNLILRQRYGNGTGNAGTAVRVFCNSDTYKPSWFRMKDVNTEVYSQTPANDWTYCVELDGDNTSSFTAASCRDVWISGGRYQAGTFASAAFRLRCVVNFFFDRIFINGANGLITVSGADATHKCATGLITGSGIGTIQVDFAQNITLAACNGTDFSCTANSSNVTFYGNITNFPSIAATAVGCSFMGICNAIGAPIWTGGATGLVNRTADRQAVVAVDPPAGFQGIVRFSKAGVTRWDLFDNDSTGNLQINSASKSGAVLVAPSTGVTSFGYGLVHKQVTVTYSANMNLDVSTGNVFFITVTDANNMTITHSNSSQGQSFIVHIVNTSGGAMGTITWTGFKLAAFTNPATANNRSITFTNVNGTVRETSRTPADVPN